MKQLGCLVDELEVPGWHQLSAVFGEQLFPIASSSGEKADGELHLTWLVGIINPIAEPLLFDRLDFLVLFGETDYLPNDKAGRTRQVWVSGVTEPISIYFQGLYLQKEKDGTEILYCIFRFSQALQPYENPRRSGVGGR